MAKTADTIAIYSRKSRYTGKGESIGNQIDLCREYIRTHYGDAAAEHAVVFEDEGFSGGNLNRPDFKKMMTAAKERKFKAIVVYRLDRISRNISDFSSLIEELERETIFDGVPARRQEKGQALLHKFDESFNRFLIISLDVLICRYSPLFRAFPALFISEEPHKSFYYPLCCRSQK